MKSGSNGVTGEALVADRGRVDFALLAEGLDPGHLAGNVWQSIAANPDLSDLVHGTLELSARQFPGNQPDAVRLDAALRMGVALAISSLSQPK